MKKYLCIVLFLLGLGGGYVVYNHGKTDEIDGAVTLYGNIDIRDVRLGFRVPGKLAALHCDEGDRVEKGSILATLDRVPFEEEMDLSSAELAECEAILSNAQKLYERRSSLVASGAVSQSSYDDALAARDEAVARCNTAKAKFARATRQLADTVLASPASGTILTRVRESGSVLAVGEAVYSLALDAPVWVRAYVDEASLGRVAPGSKAKVMTDGGRTYTAQVGFVSPQAEFTPKSVETPRLRTDLVYRLRIIIDSPDAHLRQGMPVTVVLLGEEGSP